MADIKKQIQNHLKKARVMQLATSADNKPWVCNVHFYSDDNLYVYWISTTERRHSRDIEKNPHIAVTIKIHEDTPKEPYIIGLSAEGKAELIVEKEAKKIADQYKDKLGKPQSLIDDIFAGRNPHKFYRLKPMKFVLFDTKNFTGNPRQEYTL
jgi:uncharacterized protein YhbP (UPF0306 family)